MIKYLEDLRFVIGLFFAILSIMLMTVGTVDSSNYSDSSRLNLWSGAAMGIFALVMLTLSFFYPAESETSV